MWLGYGRKPDSVFREIRWYPGRNLNEIIDG